MPKKLSRKEIEEGLKTLPISSILGANVEKALTPKQKLFARKVAQGASKADAYREAYPTGSSASTLRNDPYRLASNPRVAREIEAYTLALEAARYRTPAALRELVIQTLTQTIIDPDVKPAIRVNAAKILGTVTEVAAFTERKEVRTISSSEDARAKIFAEIRELTKAGAEDIPAEADQLLAELAGLDTHPTGTPPVQAQESQIHEHTIPHEQSHSKAVSSDPDEKNFSLDVDPPSSFGEDPPLSV